MIWDKVAISLAIVCALLVAALGWVGYILNDTYKQVAKEQVRTQECLVSLEDLNAALAKSNAAIKQLEIDAKNYKYSKNKLQLELNKVYEEFNGATTCQGIVNNITHSFDIMINRLKDLEDEIEINEALLPPHIRQFIEDIDSKPSYTLNQHTKSNMTPYLKRRANEKNTTN